MVSVAAMARSHDRVSCYHVHGRFSHHLGGNVGVRVTLRVAIMSTTGEWPECDQGDGALLALACK